MRNTTALAIVCLLGLSACGRPVEARTTHYFETHEADRKSVINQCKNADRQYQPQEECGSAMNADYIVSMKHDMGGKPN
ncbi:MAG: hypothetical protein EOO77_00260 [Oxalobacteraceae bacterium]|jgi:hypothetical protein|nr:MAG: hypothetical protein EOO77_00260 [Oxalobacteraceae bacterium]